MTKNPESITRSALRATVHCLTGCAIGEVLGMIIATAFGWANTPSIVLSIVLAFFFGYLLTMRGVLRAAVLLLGIVGAESGSRATSRSTKPILNLSARSTGSPNLTTVSCG